VALKAIGGHINVGQFTRNERVTEDLRCRGSVDPIEVPGVPFEDYVQRAFSEELKVAGVFDARSKIVLSGVVEGLELSTVASGYWAIDLRVNSTNGKSAFVREHYDFPVAFDGLTACKWAADAYLPAVQDLIGKLVTSPDFKALIEP
jgi:hypothetical protein